MRTQYHRALLCTILLCTSLLTTCRDRGVEPKPPVGPTISIAAEDVGITESSLRIRFLDTTVVRSFALLRDNQLIAWRTISRSDTLITDTTLLRGRTYQYRVYRLQDSIRVDSSDRISVQTIDSSSILVKIANAFVTEVEVRLVIDDRNPLRQFEVMRDGQLAFSGNLAGRETVLVDDGRLPSRTYTYSGYRIANGASIDSSGVVSATTFDTTSHEFTWQIDTLGLMGSSLRDGAIINQDNIWVVGRLYGSDSVGHPEDKTYNAARWSGATWTLERVPTRALGGSVYAGELYCILGFGTNDIWTFSIAGSYSHWNGSVWKSELVLEMVGSGMRLWGRNSSDLYLVGTSGGISHFNGTSWHLMPSGTDVDLLDVWGSPDGKQTWACGWKDFKPTVLLKLNGSSWEKVYQDDRRLYNHWLDSLSGPLMGVWTDGGQRVFVLSMFDLYECQLGTRGAAKALWRGDDVTQWGGMKMRGNAINNIFAVGSNGGSSKVWHYNGMTWKRLDNLMSPLDVLYGVAVSENTVVITGVRYYSGVEFFGVVYTGRR